jgi:hypothetical protein
MLFRPQKIAVTAEGAVMAADAETIELFATTGGFGSLGELLQKNRTPLRTVDLDTLDRDNAAAYWDRDERRDLAISLNRGRPALDALCRVLEKWIAHMVGVTVTIQPQSEIDDKRWVWHVGLDAEASSLLNDLYNRADVDDARMGRLLCLFELRFAHPGDMRPAIAGPSGVSRDGDGCRWIAPAQTAEPAPQPAARVAAVIAASLVRTTIRM